MAENRFKLIAIVGPTAAGKTELSVNLAADLDCQIISADSRQIYKELNIGTAKPDKRERKGIRHYFLDHVSIHEYYSAGRFEQEAIQLIRELSKKTDRAIMTGGSGLYVEAVCGGIEELPGPDEKTRAELQHIYDIHGLAALNRELKEKDPETWEAIDRQNPKRLIRSLEMIRQTGKKLSEVRTGRKKERNFDILKIGLDLDRKELYKRINHRADLMLETGLLNEVKSLLHFKEHVALKTVGYQEFVSYFENEYDLDEAIRLFKRNSRRYAKRQLTWFKRDKDIEWFYPYDYKNIIQKIKTFLK